MPMWGWFLAILVSQIVLYVLGMGRIYQVMKNTVKGHPDLPDQLSEIQLSIGYIHTVIQAMAEGQKLSTVLTLSPASLKVSPEDFAPQKDNLRVSLLRAFEKEDHPDPNTRAWCIINHSGWESFVDSTTRQKAQNALARLLVNGKPKKTRAFLEELVDKL